MGVPTLATISKFVQGLEIAPHDTAHLMFGLDMPKDIDEVTDDMRECCEMMITLGKEDRDKVREYIQLLAEKEDGK